MVRAPTQSFGLYVHRYEHVLRSASDDPYVCAPTSRLVHTRYVYIPEQIYLFGLIHKFIKFSGCLEAASERTKLPGSSEHTKTPDSPLPLQ